MKILRLNILDMKISSYKRSIMLDVLWIFRKYLYFSFFVYTYIYTSSTSCRINFMYKQSMYKTLQVVVIVVTGFLYT